MNHLTRNVSEAGLRQVLKIVFFGDFLTRAYHICLRPISLSFLLFIILIWEKHLATINNKPHYTNLEHNINLELLLFLWQMSP